MDEIRAGPGLCEATLNPKDDPSRHEAPRSTAETRIVTIPVAFGMTVVLEEIQGCGFEEVAGGLG